MHLCPKPKRASLPISPPSVVRLSAAAASQAQTGGPHHFAVVGDDVESCRAVESQAQTGGPHHFASSIDDQWLDYRVSQAQTGRYQFAILAISDPTVKIYCSKPRWEPAPICRENMEQNLPREIEKLQPQTGPYHFAKLRCTEQDLSLQVSQAQTGRAPHFALRRCERAVT